MEQAMWGNDVDVNTVPASELLLRSLPDPAVLVDAQARLVWGNPAAERLFGVSLEDGLGQSALDYIHPDDLELAALSMESVKSKDAGTLLELRIRSVEGWRLVEVRGAGCDGAVLLTLRDLTERRRWEVAGDEVARFRALTQNSSSLTLLLARDGAVTSSSGVLTRLLGVDQEWLEGRHLVELVHEADHEVLRDVLGAAGANPPGAAPMRSTVDLRLCGSEGRVVPFEMTFTDLLDDPTVEGVLVTGHDVSERVRVVEDLREANSAFAATLESTADGILVVDSEGQLTSFNRRFVEMWMSDGGTPAELDEAAVLWLMAAQLRDPTKLAARAHDLTVDAEASSHDTLELIDGRTIERYSYPQRIDGAVSGRVWSFRDVTEHRRLAAELAHQAFHDALTGLANQALFRDRVQHALERLERDGSLGAVLFIDLDDFKRVNDSLGHSAGDSMLVTVAERISSCLRTGDTAARLGGDEFAVLIDAVNGTEDASAVSERILESLRQPIAIGSSLVTTEASIGIAYGDGTMQVDELLRNADLAMYTAKADGKNCCRVFETEMHRAAVERLDLETHLRGAAARGELVVEYQPVVELDSRRVVAMEALVRWLHPQRGLLGPLAFIPFAEEGGLIEEIGQHVLHAACEAARGWVDAVGSDAPSVCVNLSPRQLADPALPAKVEQLLGDVGLPPRLLTLEITEGELMRDPVGAVGSLERLGRLGVQLAVDDFGTGYSSLAYLRQFPVDVLKIDRSFMGEADDPHSWSLATAIIQIAHALELTPIAEGVETEAQVEALRSFGCSLAQGFHLARPMSAERALAAIVAGPRLEHEPVSSVLS